ncbi:hypothetical protein [Haliscomenobacter sp.]|uniref:hypothetical protein n=1 Tax=Haliscomenobacter sp. TaxID=2717303 RepID=UPI003BA879F0
MTTSGSAAKTSVAQGTKIDFEVRSTGTINFVPVLRTLTILLGLNTTDVLAALPLVGDLYFTLLIINFLQVYFN